MNHGSSKFLTTCVFDGYLSRTNFKQIWIGFKTLLYRCWMLFNTRRICSYCTYNIITTYNRVMTFLELHVPIIVSESSTKFSKVPRSSRRSKTVPESLRKLWYYYFSLIDESPMRDCDDLGCNGLPPKFLSKSRFLCVWKTFMNCICTQNGSIRSEHANARTTNKVALCQCFIDAKATKNNTFVIFFKLDIMQSPMSL